MTVYHRCANCERRCRGLCCRPCKHLQDNPMLLLLAAAGLPVQPLTVEQLTVAAWRMRPDRFGLRGFPEHADIGRVRNLLYGTNGLVGRGFFKATGEGKVLLSQLARMAAERHDMRLLLTG